MSGHHSVGQCFCKLWFLQQQRGRQRECLIKMQMTWASSESNASFYQIPQMLLWKFKLESHSEMIRAWHSIWKNRPWSHWGEWSGGVEAKGRTCRGEATAPVREPGGAPLCENAQHALLTPVRICCFPFWISEVKSLFGLYLSKQSFKISKMLGSQFWKYLERFSAKDEVKGYTVILDFCPLCITHVQFIS